MILGPFKKMTFFWVAPPNNFLLDIMERSTERVGRGVPIANDGIWLSSATTSDTSINLTDTTTDRWLFLDFSRRRHLFVKHLHLFCHKGEMRE
jgi:hypothetical protein